MAHGHHHQDEDCVTRQPGETLARRLDLLEAIVSGVEATIRDMQSSLATLHVRMQNTFERKVGVDLDK